MIRIVVVTCLLVLAGDGARSTASTLAEELRLPGMSAFALGMDTNIQSVKELNADSLGVVLSAGRERREQWTRSPSAIALELAGGRMPGRYQEIEAFAEPSEDDVEWVRVTVQDGGLQNDSYDGQRLVVWLSVSSDGVYEVRRALWAHLCRRTHWSFYSAEPCP